VRAKKAMFFGTLALPTPQESNASEDYKQNAGFSDRSARR